MFKGQLRNTCVRRIGSVLGLFLILFLADQLGLLFEKKTHYVKPACTFPCVRNGTIFSQPERSSFDCDSCFQFNYSPVIVPAQACRPSAGDRKGRSPRVLAVVLSYYARDEHRRAIRETWAGDGDGGGGNLETIFLLGLEKDGEKNRQIKEESELRGDIFQVQTLESYRNATFKVISALKWISINCQNFDYIVKLDDDVYLNRAKLFRYIATKHNPSSGMFCRVQPSGKPDRSASSKWFVPYDQYPYLYYPGYCYGPFYAFSFSDLNKIVKNIENVPYFDIEDVYITGLVAHKASVRRIHLQSIVNIRESEFRNLTFFSSCLYQHHVIASHGHSPFRLRSIWSAVQKATCPPQSLQEDDGVAIERRGRCRLFCYTLFFLDRLLDTCHFF